MKSLLPGNNVDVEPPGQRVLPFSWQNDREQCEMWKRVVSRDEPIKNKHPDSCFMELFSCPGTFCLSLLPCLLDRRRVLACCNKLLTLMTLTSFAREQSKGALLLVYAFKARFTTAPFEMSSYTIYRTAWRKIATIILCKRVCNEAEPFIGSRSGIFSTCGQSDYVYVCFVFCFCIVKFFLAVLPRLGD